MKDQQSIDEINTIFQEAPAAREALRNNCDNLNNVADYCEKNYVQMEDPSKALEETKAFTTQSLASVAYQISALATSVLKLLDAQATQLQRMESSVNIITQTVDMHREKVARREIAAFTTAKRIPRTQRIISAATSQDPKPKYSRTPITYTALDSVGHGVREYAKQLEKTGTMSRRQSSREAGGTLGRSSRAQEPVRCPVAPSLSSVSERSVGSSGGIAVPPPVVPSWTASDVTPTPPEESYGPPPPPVMSQPGRHAPSSPAPPLETAVEENAFPPPMTSDIPLPPPISDGFELPAPPPSGFSSGLEFLAPPPPPDAMGNYDDIMPPLPPPAEYNLSAPPNYLEKVVALYSYNSGKPGDLAFQEGAVIYLTKRTGDGWCEGVLDGAEGFFPGNYVERRS
ncbi:hypothetical protein AAFF_G00261100 [Aldrovandia affinis]|uniref:ABI gene family member 3 n=1 Tax=Aldrovandia affinis TaxID=143900 RepID=A0AAD7RC67_9TELE|nr:hypothetical protein AAFF_G00261100 [Aldrovandia affinis]